MNENAFPLLVLTTIMPPSTFYCTCVLLWGRRKTPMVPLSRSDLRMVRIMWRHDRFQCSVSMCRPARGWECAFLFFVRTLSYCEYISEHITHFVVSRPPPLCSSCQQAACTRMWRSSWGGCVVLTSNAVKWKCNRRRSGAAATAVYRRRQQQPIKPSLQHLQWLQGYCSPLIHTNANIRTLSEYTIGTVPL
jgi:hypothetical protein